MQGYCNSIFEVVKPYYELFSIFVIQNLRTVFISFHSFCSSLIRCNMLPLSFPQNDVVVVALHSAFYLYTGKVASVTCISKTRDPTSTQ